MPVDSLKIWPKIYKRKYVATNKVKCIISRSFYCSYSLVEMIVMIMKMMYIPERQYLYDICKQYS